MLKRREFLKLGLTGAALSCLSPGCEETAAPPAPQPSDEVRELTDGRTLYDDFDGSGNLQAYNWQDLAESGRLSSVLWESSQGAEVVRDPEASALLTVINEAGEIVGAVPHVPGMPCPSSKKLFWTGARDGQFEAGSGVVRITKGQVYGSAEVLPSDGRGWVLRLTSSLNHLMGSMLTSPREVDFADFRTFSADVMVPSAATALSFYAALDYHTTIPEQPPGKSWVSDIGIHKLSNGQLNLFAQCFNVNSGMGGNYFLLGQAQFDTWYSVRQDILTRKEDPTLGEKQLRIEYYVDGVLREWVIPADSDILLDPSRLGWGPNRLLINFVQEAGGDGIAYFDNVKAVYRNRIR